MGIRQQVKLRPAVFLDKDGTIIHQVELLTELSKVRLLPHIAKAIRRLNQAGLPAISISNQPVVARGLITPEGVKDIDALILHRLRRAGAQIDDFYFCPHHPNATLKEYRKKCSCRKPEPGLILKAAKKYHVDLKQSFMVGDALIDTVSGQRAGVKTILVKTGPGHTRLDKLYSNKPDFTVKNMNKAVDIILKSFKK